MFPAVLGEEIQRDSDKIRRNPSVTTLEQNITAPDIEAVLIDEMPIQPDLQLDMVAQASAVTDISPGVPLVVKRVAISITGKGAAIVAFPIESTRELDGHCSFSILVLIEAQLRLIELYMDVVRIELYTPDKNPVPEEQVCSQLGRCRRNQILILFISCRTLFLED